MRSLRSGCEVGINKMIMGAERECVQMLREISGKREMKTFLCEVTAVDGATCNVTRVLDEKKIEDVSLNVTQNVDHGIVITPKIGSYVLITNIYGDKWAACQFSGIEKITVNADATIVLNGGENGGLIKIQELTDKLNALVQAFNTHTHPVPGVTPGTASTTSSVIAATAQQFNKSDYENIDIKH